jgi:uncharacterized OsmC-like protein
VSGTMNDTQRNRLLIISDACPVSKILKSGNNTIDSLFIS